MQPFGWNLHAVFFDAPPRESIDFHYERKLYAVAGEHFADPRVTHNMVLAVDSFGNELQSVAIGYGRRYPSSDPVLTSADQTNQSTTHVTYTESSYTSLIDTATAYRTPLPAQICTFELINVTAQILPDIPNLFTFDEMGGYVAEASDGFHDLPFEDVNATGATTSAPYRRQLGITRTLYLADDLSGPLILGTWTALR